MKPVWYIVGGLVVLSMGIRVILSGTFGKYDQFPVPPIAGWLVIVWSVACIVYGLWKILKSRGEKGDDGPPE